MNNRVSLTKQNIDYIRYAFAHFFPEDTIYSADKPFSSGEFNWKSRSDFIDFIYRLTGVYIKSAKDISGIKKAELKIEEIAKETSVTEKEVESNLPDKEAREQMEAERQRRENEINKAKEAAQNEIQRSIKRQQELAKALKDKKAYVKVETPKSNQLSQEQQDSINTLRNAAHANPRELIDQITAQIEKRITPSASKTATPEEIHLLAKEAAYDTVRNLGGQSSAQEAAILHAAVKIGNTTTLQATTQNVANEQVLRYIQNRNLAASTFGETFADNVFGPQNLDNITVTFSDSFQEGFGSYDLSQIPQRFSNTLSGQDSFFSNVSSYGVNEIKSQFLRQASSQLESWIGNLPADSSLAQVYNSELVQGALSYFGIGGSGVAWESTNIFGQIAIDNGFAPILSWLGEKTGIDFGISQVAGALGKEVVGSSIAGQAVGSLAAGEVAGTVAGEAAGVAAGAAAGSIVPVLGTIVGAVAGWLSTKILPWIKEHKELFVGGIVSLIALPFAGSLLTALLIGAGAGIITGFVGGGIPAVTGALASIGGLFMSIGSASLAAIGTPIIVTVISLPIFIALTMFIISAGAYVVPPSTGTTFTGSIHCTEDKELSGINYTVSSPIATRALHIVDDLYQGFWCYWNRSPKAPSEYFPKDVLLYPPGYPDIFDYKLFLTNPNPPESAGPNLFWCTYLVIKAYSENNASYAKKELDPNCPNIGNSQCMFNNWPNQVIDANKATPSNIVPGSVVFFHVTTGPDRLNHVAIVYSVDPGGIVIVESNAPLKTQSISFKSSGVGVTDLPLMEVKYFGLP